MSNCDLLRVSARASGAALFGGYIYGASQVLEIDEVASFRIEEYPGFTGVRRFLVHLSSVCGAYEVENACGICAEVLNIHGDPARDAKGVGIALATLIKGGQDIATGTGTMGDRAA